MQVVREKESNQSLWCSLAGLLIADEHIKNYKPKEYHHKLWAPAASFMYVYSNFRGRLGLSSGVEQAMGRGGNVTPSLLQFGVLYYRCGIKKLNNAL